MRQIINRTTTRVYMNGRLYDKTDTDTIEVPDPTPTPAPVRTLTTHAQACAHCHQAQTACRCRTTQPHTQAQDDDWMPLSIMTARATVTNPAAMEPVLDAYGRMVARQPASIPAQDTDPAPAPMSAETRAIRTAQADWWNLYVQCRSHLNCLVPDRQLRDCSTPQLTALSRELQSGRVVKEWRDEAMEAWKPRGLLDHSPSKP